MSEMSYCSFSGGEEYKNHFEPGESLKKQEVKHEKSVDL